VDNYFDVANQEVQCIALIEDHEAVINLPKLVKVSGIDVFYVAPSDMAASMGKTGNPSDPLVQKTIKNAIQIIVDSGNIAGTLVNEGNMEYFIDLGARCLGIPWPLLLEDASKRFFETLSSKFGA
jgi:4-hydroxy-2-oxoheptanedioate aldolase